MKRNAGLILIIALSLLFLNLAAEVKNANNPLKGEWDFQAQKVWELESAGDDVLVQVGRIRVDDDGKIYALDRKHFKLFVFSPEGKFLYSFGKQGEGPGEYKMPFDFFLVGDYVIVPDQGKIHYFKKAGNYVKSFNAGRMVFPRWFIDDHRFLLVQDREDEKNKPEELEIYDLNTNQRTTIAKVAAEKALSASGTSGQGQIVLRIKMTNTTPMVVVTTLNSQFYFGKNDVYMIKKTDLNGKELLSFSLPGKERQKIPLEFKRKWVDGIILNGGKIPKDMADQIVKDMSDTFTFFSDISIEENGSIYVYVNNVLNETGQEIDIFSPGGKYLYHSVIKLPEGLKRPRFGSLEIKGQYLYVFAEDDEGEGKLVKYKIVKPITEK